MNNFSIRTKLLCGFTIVLVLLCGVGFAGLYCLSLANFYSDSMGEQKDVEDDAEILKALVYQTRFTAMRGLYSKDIRVKDKMDKNILQTYRDYLDGRIEVLDGEANEILQRIIGRLDGTKQQEAQDIEICEKIRPLFRDYADLTTEWADIQDKILDSASQRVMLADSMKNAIDQIIQKTDENATQEEKTVEINEKSEPYTHRRLVMRQQQLGHILEQIELCRRLTREQITISDPAALQEFNSKVFAIFDQTRKYISEVQPLFRTAENAENAQKALEYFSDWETEVHKYTEYIARQQTLFHDFGIVAQNIVSHTETVIEHANARATESSEALDTMIAYANMAIYGVIIAAGVIGITLGLVLTRNITSGISKAVTCMNSIAAEGDLNQSVSKSDMERQDEIGSLMRSVHEILETFRSVESLARELADGNWQAEVRIRGTKDAMNINLASMLDQINEALMEIHKSINQVSTGAGEVASASHALSNGTQTSAASVEEISASMHEISSQTSTNASNASEAQGIAQAASQAAAEGQKAMKDMVNAMSRITDHSQEIQRVIKVIDDIAFQTNLLALNAAVEAARAGAHGKGFAVVAEEVRNLAARSSKAANETTDLISRSGEEIRSGGAVAVRTSETLNAIVGQIEKTSNLVSEIAVASKEQAEGVKQITIGLQQIDSVTQQNTASAEESASASNEMSHMAQRLQKLISKFKLRPEAIKKQVTSPVYHDEEIPEPEMEFAGIW